MISYLRLTMPVIRQTATIEDAYHFVSTGDSFNLRQKSLVAVRVLTVSFLSNYFFFGNKYYIFK
jgi:hypothetical protein